MTLSEIADVLEGFLAHRIVYFGRFGGRISQLRGSLRELQHYANETREYRRFPTPHESKPPFGLSETSRLYRVYGVGDGVVK